MTGQLRLVGSPDAAPETGADERAALQGDESAWDRLIARHDHKVVVSLLGRGLPLDRARDLAQETWLKLVQNARAGRLRELTLPGLAIVQAGFLAGTAQRRSGRLFSWTRADDDLHGTATLEDEAIGRERLRRIAATLTACPPRARAVFEQHYDNPGLAYADLATRVGLSEQRVKQIVCEIRARLREALAEDGTP